MNKMHKHLGRYSIFSWTLLLRLPSYGGGQHVLSLKQQKGGVLCREEDVLCLRPLRQGLSSCAPIPGEMSSLAKPRDFLYSVTHRLNWTIGAFQEVPPFALLGNRTPAKDPLPRTLFQGPSSKNPLPRTPLPGGQVQASSVVEPDDAEPEPIVSQVDLVGWDGLTALNLVRRRGLG